MSKLAPSIIDVGIILKKKPKIKYQAYLIKEILQIYSRHRTKLLIALLGSFKSKLTRASSLTRSQHQTSSLSLLTSKSKLKLRQMAVMQVQSLSLTCVT